MAQITVPLFYLQFIDDWPSVILAKMNNCLPEGILLDLEITHIFLHPTYAKRAWAASPSLNKNALPDPVSIPKRKGSSRWSVHRPAFPGEQWPGRPLLGVWTGWADTLSSTLFSQICHLLKGTPKGLRPNLRGFMCLLSWLHPLSKTSFLFIYLFIYWKKTSFLISRPLCVFTAMFSPQWSMTHAGPSKGVSARETGLRIGSLL